ncbi:MAG: histidinol-phosphatase HisJ family protein [Saccharofermentans sp.]|nr:histidinol-phosphatase HisJ family protein [Saccharofermentans sp.]
MFTDTHNHTCHYSPDAKQTIDELVSAAKAQNIDVVAVTEHYEYDNPDPNDNIQTFDIDSYAKDFKEWKTEYNDITLLMGIEFGYQTHTASVIDEIAAKYDFDTVVLSNHLFRGVDLFYSKDAYKIPANLRHKEYMGVVAEMAEKCNNYTVIAHYDYCSKYDSEENRIAYYADCPKEFDRLFEVIIAKEKALEINTATSIRRGLMPDPEVLKRYVSMGGKLITFASDAHVSENLGRKKEEFVEFAKSCGIKEACYFKNKKPIIYGL